MKEIESVDGGGGEKDRLAKETRADNVRVMVASGYFYIPGAPLKANVRDNVPFSCTDSVLPCTVLHHRLTPVRFLVAPGLSRIRSRILHLPGECASARENSDGEGKCIRTTPSVERAYYSREFAEQRNRYAFAKYS